MLRLITKVPQNNFVDGALYKRHLVIVIIIILIIIKKNEKWFSRDEKDTVAHWQAHAQNVVFGVLDIGLCDRLAEMQPYYTEGIIRWNS